MTTRGGGSPRDDRGPAPERPVMAHPLREPVGRPGRWRSAAAAGRRSGTVTASELAGRRRGGRGSGSLRLVLFLLLAAGLVLALVVTVGRPIVRGVVVGLAGENPSALGIGFVAEMVREDMGSALTDPAGPATADVPFVVEDGDTAATIAARLVSAGVLRDARAFVLISLERNTSTSYRAGDFVLRQTMTPDQIASALLAPPAPDLHIVLSIRTGLRIEQLAALIQAKPVDRGLGALTMSAAAFLDLVRNPPASLLADYPWVKIPKGGSLEGYLAAGDYRLLPDATPDVLVRLMLDQFRAEVGPERMKVAASRGLSWYEVLSLASIVEQEAAVDSERPLIAGVYQGRIDKGMLLNADPTVIYGNDTLKLAKLPVTAWPTYSFWGLIGTPLADLAFPAYLAGFQTYQHTGLIPAPICTPTVASIDAALTPTTKPGYVYFVAKQDGSRTHAFARTAAEHEANLRKYGYLP